mgnify:CR=1 FL=1
MRQYFLKTFGSKVSYQLNIALKFSNVEMAQAVGNENIFIFGLKSNEVDDICVEFCNMHRNQPYTYTDRLREFLLKDNLLYQQMTVR